MQIKPESIQSVAIESWATREHLGEPAQAVKPVPKADATQGTRRENKSSSGQLGNKDAGSDPKQAQTLVDEVQSHLDNLNIQLHFQLDDRTGEPVVQVLDPASGDVIRQIPPEELLEIRGKLEELRGILFDRRA